MKAPTVVLTLMVIVFPIAFSHGDQPATGFTCSLFDGKTLHGWHVTGCEAVVEDGAILIKAGNGLVRTDHRYADFVLDLEWKALSSDRWDSGIYFRCELPPEGRPWPRRFATSATPPCANCRG